jgi:hypothetical protein
MLTVDTKLRSTPKPKQGAPPNKMSSQNPKTEGCNPKVIPGGRNKGSRDYQSHSSKKTIMKSLHGQHQSRRQEKKARKPRQRKQLHFPIPSHVVVFD